MPHFGAYDWWQFAFNIQRLTKPRKQRYNTCFYGKPIESWIIEIWTRKKNLYDANNLFECMNVCNFRSFVIVWFYVLLGICKDIELLEWGVIYIGSQKKNKGWKTATHFHKNYTPIHLNRCFNISLGILSVYSTSCGFSHFYFH